MPRLRFVVGLGIGFGFEFGWCTVSCAWFVSKLLVNAWAYWLKVKCSRDCSTCVREMTDRMNSCCPWFVSIWGCCQSCHENTRCTLKFLSFSFLLLSLWVSSQQGLFLGSRTRDSECAMERWLSACASFGNTPQTLPGTTMPPCTVKERGAKSKQSGRCGKNNMCKM